MELFTPEVGLIFWMLIAFLLVFFILAKFAWPVIIKGVEERRAFIDNSVAAAREANERLAGLREEGEKIVKKAREEELRILKTTEEASAKLIQEAKAKAGAEADKLIAEARTVIEKEKEKAVKDIHNRVAALSIDIAEKILRRDLENRDAQKELAEKFISEAQN
jgi:F-type H+-transporting ATPase subunit b